MVCDIFFTFAADFKAIKQPRYYLLSDLFLIRGMCKNEWHHSVAAPLEMEDTWMKTIHI